VSHQIPPLYWANTIIPDEGDTFHPLDVIVSGNAAFTFLGDIRNHPNGRVWVRHTDSRANEIWTQVHYIDGFMHPGTPTQIVSCSDGDYGIVGTTYPADNIRVPFLIRLEPNGNSRWKITYPLWGNETSYSGGSLVACSDNGFAIAGYQTQRWRPAWYIHLLRTDSDGNHLWNTTYPHGGPGRITLIQCEDGGFAIAREDYYDIRLIRTDSLGTPLWNYSFTFPYRSVYYSQMIMCQDGGFAIAGRADEYSFQGNEHQAFLFRLDSEGNPLWNHTYGIAEDDSAQDLVECMTGGFALVGSTEAYGVNNPDLWLVRTDDDGNELWTNTYDHVPGVDSRGVKILETAPGVFLLMASAYSEASGSAMWLLSVPDFDFYEPSPIDPVEIPWDQLLPFILLGIGLGIPILILSAAIIWAWRSVRED
jgi:hypothetical protein